MKIENKNMKYLKSYNSAVNSVCKEGKYLASDEGFDIDSSRDFLKYNINNGNVQFFLVNNNDEVVGWCDITPKQDETSDNIGVLGMGIIKTHRNKGYGKKLLESSLDEAKDKNIEKIELEVYKSNRRAILLYESFGFKYEERKVKSSLNDNTLKMVLYLDND